ncbi:hypothetical protein F4802DRAFT_602755 [Xylaria palmicola]|nr:hypothetical protein F4802DRAFT_602755 [Xylaria palmicola]
MPRKVRAPADAAQNRASQQRSRARRQAHVAALEARVRAFERGGVRASLAMQQAAREVAWANERLVELLAARGVARGEVDEFLRRRKEEEEFGTGVTVGRAAPDGSRGLPGGVTGAFAPRTCGTTACGAAQPGDARESGRARVCGAGQSLEGDAGVGASTSGRASAVGHGESSRTRDGGTSFAVDEAPSTLVTSCDSAALIIAGFQGHEDVSHARAALGCGDTTDCHVRNTRLFQLMDEAGERP